MKQLEFDFDSLLPPLSTEEFDALRADVKKHGVLTPVYVDESGEVLDGRHRLKIDPKAPRKVIKGLTPAQKAAFVFRCNFVRRNLTRDQKAEARTKMKAVAKALRDEDHRKWTQAAIAAELGVDQAAVSRWFANGHNMQSHNVSAPEPIDARVKLPPKAKEAVAERVQNGETVAQVAADVGVSEKTVHRTIKAETKQAAAKQEREQIAKRIKGDCGVIHGDFRDVQIEPASVQLVLTDPPYDKDAVPLYGDLGRFAARVLVKGGWLLAYAGQSFLPDVYRELCESGLTFGWTFCCRHVGGDLRYRKLKIQNGWKPIIGFYKPPLDASWDWFPDVVSGGKEKSDHDWQQAESEAAHFVRALSTPGGIVCDPLAGSGTVLLASKKLGRRWIGIEKDKEHVQTARCKLNDSTSE